MPGCGLNYFFTKAWNLYTFSIEISTVSLINKGLYYVVRISLGTPVGGLNSFY